MQIPLQIVFRDVPRSEALVTEIRRRAAKLDQYYDHITSCRITVESAGKHKHQGILYDIGIDLTLPGNEFVIKDRHGHEDAYVALRDAFEAAERKLHEHARLNRGHAKASRFATDQVPPPED